MAADFQSAGSHMKTVSLPHQEQARSYSPFSANLDLRSLEATPLCREPFQHLVVPGFIHANALDAIHHDYPRINQPGSFPVEELKFGPAFAGLLEELSGPAMRRAFEKKFDLDLSGRPMMVTVRGQSGTRDGNVHTDGTSKIITVLIYMNPKWEDGGGRLRLLRSATNIDDVLLEIPPIEGTLVAFRRSNNSYHGHKPFIGARRVIQVNWVTDRGTRSREIWRHRISARLKRSAALFHRREIEYSHQT
jgi:hypothetical protein